MHTNWIVYIAIMIKQMHFRDLGVFNNYSDAIIYWIALKYDSTNGLFSDKQISWFKSFYLKFNQITFHAFIDFWYINDVTLPH